MAQDRGSIRVHGPAIRFAREQRGLSTRELARRAGIAQPWLVQLETGIKTGMRGERFAALVSALQVEPSLLRAAPQTAAA